MNRPVGRTALQTALSGYNPWDDTEKQHVRRMIEFIKAEPDCFERSLAKGHITGSAWILNHSGTHAALVHHRKLDRWLQPGGHADGNKDIFDVARTEAMEETGMENLLSTGEIFDVDVHLIPANKRDAAHYHYDIRFMFTAPKDAILKVSQESHEVRWIAAESIEALTGYEPSILRMKEKWLSVKQKGEEQIR